MLTKIGNNLHVISLPGVEIFCSYETPVAIQLMNTGLAFHTDKKYSRTTSKHIRVLKELYPDMTEVSEATFQEMLREAK